MEKPHSPLRKTSHPRKQLPSKVAREGEEPRFKLQKTPTKDQCCQTEQQHECQAVGTDADLKSPVHSVEPGDPPLLQQQLQTSKSGIQQIIECFRSGTAQLKHILLREVDTIFECKLCRSLFRGLPNLITHKEFYCFPNLLDVNDPPSDNKQSKAIKELLEAIYPRKDQPEYVVRLEPIESNQNAVFQFISREDDQVPAEQETVCPPVPEVARVQPEKNLEREELVVEPVEPVEPTVEEELPGEEEASAPHGEPEPETRGEEEAVIASGLDGVRIACSLCGKEFSSWKAVQRHCHKVHEGRLEELRKLMGTRTLPLSLLSIVKHWPRRALGAAGRSCPVCRKSFATNANVRRHFDEVHRGLRRDSVTSYAATGPRQPLRLEAPAHMRRQRSGPQFNLSACRCLLCKRKYSSQVMLKKHMRIVHKIRAPENGPSPGAAPEVSDQNDGEKDKRSAAEKKKPKKELESPKVHKSKLSLGFDFRQLYCKLCKRQFTSKQNLTKHIELHTDGDDIYIKFYCCPICSYESRRKRDVIRHITVVHKKPASYLDKIVPTLEMRAVRKLAELVLNRPMRRGPQKEDVNGQHSPPAAGSHKHETPCGSPASCRQDTPEGAVDVKVTKRMLHACDECGRAFAKKRYLESHRRIHRPKNSRPKRCRTRSKALLW